MTPKNLWAEIAPNNDDIDIHVYEELDASAEYLFRIETDYSYQEYQIDGEHFDEFMTHLPFEAADIFVYKLVRSYEQIEN